MTFTHHFNIFMSIKSLAGQFSKPNQEIRPLGVGLGPWLFQVNEVFFYQSLKTNVVIG